MIHLVFKHAKTKTQKSKVICCRSQLQGAKLKQTESIHLKYYMYYMLVLPSQRMAKTKIKLKLSKIRN